MLITHKILKEKRLVIKIDGKETYNITLFELVMYLLLYNKNEFEFQFRDVRKDRGD